MRNRVRAAFVVVLLTLACAAPATQTSWLSAPENVAPGVAFFTSTDASLVEPNGPIAVFLLRLDPARARLASQLSNDEVAGAEPVKEIADRHAALAAVNAGFFNVANGEPAGVLKVAGELVSDGSLARGAVAIRSPASGRTSLDFDQVSAKAALVFKLGREEVRIPVDGVDTTRERGKLMLYTPKYNEDTDTAANGVEWVLAGMPLVVTEIRRDAGKTTIPKGGGVLSFGGLELPSALARLAIGQQVAVEIKWTGANGVSPERLAAADHVVAGAGLLRRNGRKLESWDGEGFSGPAFRESRHPRTLIGMDARGTIWLAAIDGRQPGYSVGMSFAELQVLCDRLQLTDALNLDGGGSTTMVVKGKIVNRPSDANGPRAVGDALLVTVR